MGPQLALIGNPPPPGWRPRWPNPISFTGPAITFMPFNPFQKFAVDLLGVGFQAKAKNPPSSRKLKTFHVYDKTTGQRVSTEVAPNGQVAKLNANRRHGVWITNLVAKPVVISDVDQSQGSLFGVDPDAELERERREEASGGQMEMFNPPRPREAARPERGVRPPVILHPELQGLPYDERMRIYMERAQQGLVPFTGQEPARRGGEAFPEALPIRRRERRRRIHDPVGTPGPVVVGGGCPDCRRAAAYAMERGLPVLPCRVCSQGRATPPVVLAPRRAAPLPAPRPPQLPVAHHGYGRLDEEARAAAELEALRAPFDPQMTPDPMTPPGPPVRRDKGGRPKGTVSGTGRWQQKLKALVKHFGGQARLAPELGYDFRTISGWTRGRPPGTQAKLAINELWEVMQSGMVNPPEHWQQMQALSKANEELAKGLVPVMPSLKDALRRLSSHYGSQSKAAQAISSIPGVTLSKQHLSQILNGKRRRVSQQLVSAVLYLNDPDGRWAAANPGHVDPRALAMRDRYKEDLEAGHTGAAEYWRGQAAAYFTANPDGPPPPGMKKNAELARLMNPKRKRRRNRDSKWKKEPEEYEISLEEASKIPYFDAAMKRFLRFHETEPEAARVVRIPDGKKGVTRLDKVYVFLGRRTQTPYTVDEVESSKKDVLWYHDHPEGKEPMMILDPQTGVVSDVGGIYTVDEWFYS